MRTTEAIREKKERIWKDKKYQDTSSTIINNDDLFNSIISETIKNSFWFKHSQREQNSFYSVA